MCDPVNIEEESSWLPKSSYLEAICNDSYATLPQLQWIATWVRYCQGHHEQAFQKW